MTKNTSLFAKNLVLEALRQAFIKLNPKFMFRNPIMFTVEIGTAIMFIVCLWIQFYNLPRIIIDAIVCQFCRSHCRSQRSGTSR